MRNMFFLVILLLSFFVVSSSVFANTEKDTSNKLSPNEVVLDKKLSKLGYPNDYISIMSVEQKNDILNSKPIGFDGFTKTEYFYNANGELQEIEAEELSVLNPGDFTMMKTIPRADLTLYNGKSNLGRINGRQVYRIYVNWQWNVPTTFAYYDKIALSYNNAFQTRVSNNGNYSCRTTNYQPHITWSSTNTCGGRPSNISTGGAGWAFDKLAGTQMLNKGYAQMDIETKDNTSPTGSGVVLSKYYHKTGFSGTIGLNIGFVAIGTSLTTGFDEAAAQHAWNY